MEVCFSRYLLGAIISGSLKGYSSYCDKEVMVPSKYKNVWEAIYVEQMCEIKNMMLAETKKSEVKHG